VNRLALKSLFRSRYPIAILAGLLLAASFPNISVAGFAWLAPGLIFAASLGSRGGEAFRVGYLAGLTHYLVSLYWLLNIPYRWHSIPVGPAAGWLALSAFMALFPGIWNWLLSKLQTPSAQPRQYGTGNVFASILDAFPDQWSRRATLSFFAAAAWVAMEMLIARIFSGFPWDLLGVSQHRMVPLIQIASITGIYGVSFIVVWTSLSLLAATITILRTPAMRAIWIGDVFLPGAAILCLFAFGFRQLGSETPLERTIKVTFVQPSIPQALIWDPSQDDERFRELIALSQQALTNKTDVILWPEAAVPKQLRWYPEMLEAVSGLARSNHVWMIIGADDSEPKSGSTDPEDRDYFNSSFLISPEGRIEANYRKRGLVIFGEYIPLVRWLPFIKYLTPIQGGFTPGERAVPFRLSDLGANTAVLICFEDVFPHLAREYVSEDTDFLVNLTNNGWFGEGAAQWQHAMTALFRAIENGVPLVRCSNNGLTCWVDAHGRLRQIFRDQNGTIYGAGVMTAEIPLLNGRAHPLTFYTAHGDIFGWSCVGVALVVLLPALLRRKKAGAADGAASGATRSSA
jgi:apolipoprotein N-acyltransferase